MDWQSLIRNVAPTVATAFLGPLAGVAVAAVGNVLGISEATQDKIASAITQGTLSPEQITHLKELEIKFKNDEAERGFKYSELVFKDTQGAREMQVQVRSWIPPALALLVTSGFFGILSFMILNGDYKPTEPLLVMLGSLGTAWTMIIGFYFGSSSSSQNKDVLISRMKSE